MFQFYRANRTRRWTGRIIQMQNFPKTIWTICPKPEDLSGQVTLTLWKCPVKMCRIHFLADLHGIRDRYTNAHPLCERCQQEGRLVKAEQVHHIKPLAEGGDHSELNLMSLCHSCHSKIHAERGDRWHGKSYPVEDSF